MKEKRLNANQLKIIAIIAMTIDHLTWTIAPGYSTLWWAIMLHIIGRITAPIMWYFIAEGYYHTHNLKKYCQRLFILAFISHFAYDFCFGISFIPTGIFNQTGVVWSLAWGLVLLEVHKNEKIQDWLKIVITILVCIITFPSDWSSIATISIVYIGLYRGNFKKQMISMMCWILVYTLVYFIFIDKVYAFIQLFTCLSIPLLYLYNGKRGENTKVGKLFYYYYPLHLFVCGLLRIILWGSSFISGAGHL